MSRCNARRLLGCLTAPLALIAGATIADAQAGPVPLPPPVAVSQSEPGYGALFEQRNALVARQTAINRRRDDHNAVCLGIPANNTSQIAWCRSDADAIGREKGAYAKQLTVYNAYQAYYQGQTRYLRKDYSGAIPFYRQAMSFGVPIDTLMTEYYLSQARVAEKNGDMETARARMCDINAYETNRPSWLNFELEQLFGQIRGWMKRHSRKFEVRTPTCALADRG
ncbi:hypothetical protein [Novosphingobium sp.]|uniref:hypothetical protein n=1 Tax=Novosphingobium sp. TaxID=1874826 RepID=UPI0035B4EAF3